MTFNALSMYVPDDACKRGHRLRYIKGNCCVLCNREFVSKYRKKKNIKNSKEYMREWHRKNPEKQKQYDKARHQALLARNRKRNERFRRATPRWLTEDMHNEIEEIYELSRMASSLSGIPHEVDHSIPLKSEIVCGLHVPWNLQIIPRSENRSKQNKMEKK